MRKRLTVIFSIFLILINLSVYGAEGTSVWANYEVDEALQLGFVPEELQNNYTADIKRDEFAHIAVEFMNILNREVKASTEVYFTDCDDPYVNLAYKLGIINGRGDGTFAPDDNITRQEAAKVISNTYRVYSGRDAVAGVEPEFPDNAQIADWAYEDIGILYYRNIMKGTDAGFEPLGLYTREQSIVTFLRLFKFIQKENAEPDYKGENGLIEDFLVVDKGRLLSEGKEILLNGINLGGWLIMETWMSPILDQNQKMAYTDVINVLEKRFGGKKTQQLIEIYEDSFITEKDIENIEALGFNCVRVPFWQGNFKFASDGVTIDKNSNGFKRIDWLIEQCEKRGIWIILDMHGCPGGQSMNHSTGIIGKNELYENEANLKKMEIIWTELAKRYKDVKCIAAYDVMNEPQNNDGYTGDRAWQAESEVAVKYTNMVYDRMIKAIRRVDKTHIISVEGIWSTSVLPDPKKYGWSNMLYQLHIYDDTKEMIDYRVNELKKVQEDYGVAVLVGEYNSNGLEQYATEVYDINRIGRIKWTYKVVGKWGDWGLFTKLYNKIDIKLASYDKIKKALGADMATDNGFELNVSEYKKIR